MVTIINRIKNKNELEYKSFVNTNKIVLIPSDRKINLLLELKGNYRL